MTFKDLKKRVSLQVSQEETRLFERLKGKPFRGYGTNNSISKKT
ncbi:MAG: hypothetical protein ACJ71H_08540 [Nitrososphaeraceae archaeon]